MLTRLRKSFLSFVFVVLAYGVYSICVATWIERPESTQAQEEVLRQNTNDGDSSTDRVLRELAQHFPKGSWELEKSEVQVLRSPQATMVLKDFEQLNDGSLQIKPCTLIFYGDRGKHGDKAPKRGPTILQAPQGAILTFDKPLDLARGKFGNPVHGRLVGSIRIFSAGVGTAEDIEMVTSNVQISKTRIWTMDRVTFRLGNNYGAGRELRLSRAKQDEELARDLTSLGMIELLQLDRLSLELQGDDLFSRFGAQRRGGKSVTSSPNAVSRVEVRCDGPLRLDAQRLKATVEKDVSIAMEVPGQRPDTLSAKQLTMQFQRVSDGKGKQAKRELTLSLVSAVGEPVVVDAPSQQAYVEAKRIEYEFNNKKIKLRGYGIQHDPTKPDQGRVRIRNPEHEIIAPAVDFAGTEDRTTWQFVAAGPGSYTGSPDLSSFAATKQLQQSIAASWEKRLSLQPYQDRHILIVEGAAAVQAGDMGSIRADELRFELRHEQVAVATALTGNRETLYETKTVPLKLATSSKAGLHTTIQTPQLNGTLAGLTVHFQERPPRATAATPATPAHRATVPSPPGQQDAVRRYRVDGGNLTAWFDTTNRQLERLHVDGQSQLAEEAPLDGSTPMEVIGKVIDFQLDPNGRPLARLQGSPAELTTAELSITGNDIQLLGDSNRVVVPGQGSLRMQVPENFLSTETENVQAVSRQQFAAQNAKPATQQVDVSWTESLAFDGRVAELQGEVEAKTVDMVVRMPELVVTLDQPIDFANPQSATQPQVEKVVARGGVFVASRGRDEQGRPESYQQIVTRDFSADLKTGDAVANGPGWMAVTTPSNASMLGRSKSSSSSAGDQSQLSQLSIAFARQLTGNILLREAHLTDDIRGWFGAVQRWEDRVDPLTVEELGENDLRLSCHEVFVMESPNALPSQDRKPIELLAQGETYVESQRFAAKGDQIKYAEDKGMLTFQGTPHHPAQLWQRTEVGAPVSDSGRVRLIRYWPKTGELFVEAYGVDLSADVKSKTPGVGSSR